MPVRWPSCEKAAARFAASDDLPTPPLPLAIASTRVERSSEIPFVRSVTEPRRRAVRAERSSGVITSNSSATRSTPATGASAFATCSSKLARSGQPATVRAIPTVTSPPSICTSRTMSSSTTFRFSSGSITSSRAFRISSRAGSIAVERSNRRPAGTLQDVGVVASARGVVKVYGQGRATLRILDDLDLDLHAAELVAVTGRSGSGKSTLLNVIGALDRVDAGRIELCGVRLERASERELAPLRRDRIGFVFQSFHLLPELTGLENVLLPARLDGRRPSLARGRELVERLGLVAAAARLPAGPSGGGKQRLGDAPAPVQH